MYNRLGFGARTAGVFTNGARLVEDDEKQHSRTLWKTRLSGNLPQEMRGETSRSLLLCFVTVFRLHNWYRGASEGVELPVKAICTLIDTPL